MECWEALWVSHGGTSTQAHYFALEYQTLNSNRVTIKEFLAVLYTRILFKTINRKGYDGEKILLGMSKVPLFWKKDIQCEMEKICKDVSVCGGAVTTEMMDEVFTTVVSDLMSSLTWDLMVMV